MFTLEPRPPTRIIRNDAGLLEVLPQLLAAGAVSVDTEFHTERSYHPRLMLLQLRADEGEIFLVDPLAPVDLRLLGEMVRTVPLRMHGGQVDLQILQKHTGVTPGRIFDTQVAAGCVGQGYPRRLQDLVQRNLGVPMDKSETLSDWSRRPLSADQMRYAADDVWVLPRLAQALEAELKEWGNLEIAEAAMKELQALALQESPLELWKLVPGAQHLDGEGRALLQAISCWRDGVARERDLNRSAVLSDGLMLDLAKRRPATLEAMQRNRRMPSQVVKRDGPALLDLLRKTQGPIAPIVEKPAGWVELVRAAARVSELQRGVAAELTLPESVLNRLSRGLNIENWRVEALGSDFFRFLSGNVDLRMPTIWTS